MRELTIRLRMCSVSDLCTGLHTNTSIGRSAAYARRSRSDDVRRNDMRGGDARPTRQGDTVVVLGRSKGWKE
jgi:hypothetical protein